MLTIHPSLVWPDFDVECDPQDNGKVEVTYFMRALDPEVVDVLWSAVEPLLPPREQTHPLGCHRPRVPDRLCFHGLLIRLVTGSSWVDVEAILDHQVSDTALRARRDEWIAAGIFEQLKGSSTRRVRPDRRPGHGQRVHRRVPAQSASGW